MQNSTIPSPSRQADPFGLGDLMKGLTNEAARAHGAKAPFPEADADQALRLRSAFAYRQGQETADARGLT